MTHSLSLSLLVAIVNINIFIIVIIHLYKEIYESFGTDQIYVYIGKVCIILVVSYN